MNTTLPARLDRPPFLPSDIDAGRSLIRAMTALSLSSMNWAKLEEPAESIAERAWPRDRAALSIIRAAVPPMSTSSSGISALQPNPIAAFVSGLQMQSAASRLFAAGITVDLNGVYTVSIPRADASTSPPPVFVGEGAPIPVGQPVVSSGVVGPARKMALIESLTNWLADASAPTAETVIRTIMTEAAARALDAAVFSAVSADATRPAGILNGVAPLTAATGGGQAAAIADIGAIVAAIASAGGGQRVLLFVPPAKAVTLPMLAPGVVTAPNLEIVAAPSLSTTVIGVDPAGFISGYGDQPRIDVGRSSTLHMEGATPAQIGTPGSPNVVAAPTRSMFQTDSYSLRLILPCAWAMRAPGLVQLVSGVTW